MTEGQPEIDDDVVDAEADKQIANCVASNPPTSFFLFAGAGSGKTRSLVEALKVIKKTVGARLGVSGKRVGVITFTNKARDEIKRRLEYDDLFAVSTIHSFAWSLIKGLNHDIREWLQANLQSEIAELEEKESKGRAGTKASIDRINAIASKRKRSEFLNSVRKFTYSPDGDNRESNALNHSEVIKITAGFLTGRSLMQSLLVNRFPILLIDESQDTNKELIEALFYVQANLRTRFALGVVGDTMQRIYTAGKLDLGQNLADDWAKPVKKMNHRSCHRIVALINRIREPVDGQTQQGRTNKAEGYVRLFILPAETLDKPAQERQICARMAEITGDEGWLSPDEGVKTLILEHRMAANRLGFLSMWDALSGVERFQTGLRDGTLPALRFFSHLVLPLLKAHQGGDKFTVASIARKHSPLLEKRRLAASGADQRKQVEKARDAVNSLAGLWGGPSTPSFLQVLKTVLMTHLFEVPEVLRPFGESTEEPTEEPPEGEDSENDELVAWSNFLETPFEQIKCYSRYIQGEAQYDTHQGIKGLEFPRVCVIMDDSEARGFMFSYEKLFGAREEARPKDPNQETAIDRTKRLFYVTCSRAEDALALVAYTSRPEDVHNHVIREGWFCEDEIILIS